MGMFDAPTGKPWADSFKPGEPFVLTAATLVENVQTDFGKGTMIVLTIDGENYTLFGKGIENQVRAQVEGDLPSRVKIGFAKAKPGKSAMKQIVPASIALDESHTIIDVEAATKDDIPF